MPWIEQWRSANWSQAGWSALGAYALGCFTTGYYLARMCTGRDVRESGSGNVGAKNVGRMLGWVGFVVTLLGDFTKGALAVWLVRYLTKDERVAAVAVLAVVAGHVWPAQLLFRGGKGIATSVGALLIYDYQLVVAFAMLFAVVFVVLRKTVLPGLFAFACLPLVCLYYQHDSNKAFGISILAGLVLVTHRKNLVEEITRLLERPGNHQEVK